MTCATSSINFNGQSGAEHPPLIQTKPSQTNMNRQELQQQLVNNVIEGMDFKTMWSVLYDFMDESYDKFSDAELMEEVKEYYPELLD